MVVTQPLETLQVNARAFTSLGDAAVTKLYTEAERGNQDRRQLDGIGPRVGSYARMTTQCFPLMFLVALMTEICCIY
jgi:hypothetical protein